MNSRQDRIVVITGGTGGIGFQSSLGIARTGARLLVTGRNRARGEAAVRRVIDETGNDGVELVVADVASIEGIDALARALMERVDHIDVLVNNAGYRGSEPAHSDDGIEMHFAVNVLAPWRLTLAVLPALRAADGARVLNVTGGDKPAAVDPDNLQGEKGFRGLMTYQHSKSVMEAMSMALAGRLEDEGVTVNMLFPGRASTAMMSSMSTKALPGGMKAMYPLFRLLFREDGGKSAEKAARSTIWGATSSELDGVTGRYFDTNSEEQKLHPTAYDSQVQDSILGVIEASGGPS
jgi:NAD(P)-dependent dehydrogenase (short-subunit alcohol dehydrogenase family)